jgi:hypothetical protein
MFLQNEKDKAKKNVAKDGCKFSRQSEISDSLSQLYIVPIAKNIDFIFYII